MSLSKKHMHLFWLRTTETDFYESYQQKVLTFISDLIRKENFSNPQKYARTIAKYSFKLCFFSVKEYHCVYILVLIRKKKLKRRRSFGGMFKTLMINRLFT